MKQVIVREPAWRMMAAYFGINQAEDKLKKNEQLCALGGVITRHIIDIKLALPMLSPNSGAAHILVPGENWFYAICVFEQCNLSLVGSCHTHPGNLEVFMSGEDKNTHMVMFPGGISIVCNPQRREFAAYSANGRRAELLMP